MRSRHSIAQYGWIATKIDDTDSPYLIDNYEFVVTNGANGEVDIQLPPPAPDFQCEVKVRNASNATNILRDGNELIDGDGQDLSLTTEDVSRTIIAGPDRDWWIK